MVSEKYVKKDVKEEVVKEWNMLKVRWMKVQEECGCARRRRRA